MARARRVARQRARVPPGAGGLRQGLQLRDRVGPGAAATDGGCVMALYDVVTQFGTVTKEADSIKEARAWAKKAFKAGPRCVSLRREYAFCEKCSSSPCCCSVPAELERGGR